MAYILNSFDDAVDGKFLIVKSMTNQADVGTMVHIMGTNKGSGGSAVVNYRVTTTGQDYEVTFSSIKDFMAWARPDSFIARNYESFTKDEIRNYIKINNRTFASYCMPIIIALLVVVWIISILVIPGTALKIILGAVLSVVAFLAVVVIYKKQKSGVKMKMYKKLQNKWGINF